jgi:hypothetical protein
MQKKDINSLYPFSAFFTSIPIFSQGLNQQEKLKKDDIDKQPREFLPKRSEKVRIYNIFN